MNKGTKSGCILSELCVLVGLDIVNAAVLEPFLNALPLPQHQIEQQLEKSGLPPLLLHRPQGLVPLYGLKDFVCQITPGTGNQNFGFDAIQDATRKTASRNVANIPLPGHLTGLDAAKEFVGQLDSTLTGTKYFWALEGDIFWIMRTAFGVEMSEYWPIVQYNLSVMVSGMQKIYGHDLHPVAVRTGTLPGPVTLPLVLSGVPIQFGPEKAGIGFDTIDLFRRTNLPGNRLSGSSPTPHQPLEAINETVLSACLLQFLQEGATDNLVGRAAAAFGLTDRTYQRRLSDMGTSHTRLRDNARMAAALDMLCDSDQSVMSVSMDLGYANAGDFTRFFRRRSGLTPTQYRQLI